jgi:hypothetical protein
LPLAMRREQRGGGWAERDHPIGVFGLELLEHRMTALDRELLMDGELAGLEVDVGPSQGEELTAAQAGDEAQMERRHEAVATDSDEKTLGLLERPAQLPMRAITLGWLGQHDRIPGQPTTLDRFLERHTC